MRKSAKFVQGDHCGMWLHFCPGFIPLPLLLQHWLDPSKRVARQIRTTSPVTLYLGVKFYAADPCRLIEEITRYHFFLQVRTYRVRLDPTVCNQLLSTSTPFYDFNSCRSSSMCCKVACPLVRISLWSWPHSPCRVSKGSHAKT